MLQKSEAVPRTVRIGLLHKGVPQADKAVSISYTQDYSAFQNTK